MIALWTNPQLFLILLVGFAFLSLTFSRSNPMHVAIVPILAAHYLVINTLCWNAFLQTTTFQSGEVLFRFTLSPFLPAASFYLGLVAILAVLSAWISVFIGVRRISRRQLGAFSAACLTFLIALVVSARTPLAIQSWIDSLPTPS